MFASSMWLVATEVDRAEVPSLTSEGCYRLGKAWFPKFTQMIEPQSLASTTNGLMADGVGQSFDPDIQSGGGSLGSAGMNCWGEVGGLVIRSR